MGIRELKDKITNKVPIDELIIFRLPEDHNKFLVHQYIDAISEIRDNIEVRYSYSLDGLEMFCDIFDSKTHYIQVCMVDDFDVINPKIKNAHNLIIVTSKIGIKTGDIFADYIVNIPDLAEWQIKAYVETKLKGVKQVNIDRFFNAYKNDINELDKELSKIAIFPEGFNNFILENSLNFKNKIIFDLTNALSRKEVDYVDDFLKNSSDIEPMSFLTLMCNNIKNIINIQTNPKATPLDLGMTQKQFNAIKYYNINHYSKEDLIIIFEMLTSVDYKIKSGELAIDKVVDYIITNILK